MGDPISYGVNSSQKLFWLGRQDSNLRMAASKAAALPLGDAPPEGALIAVVSDMKRGTNAEV